MALNLFTVSKGLELESADFLSTSSIMFGTGTPGGDSDVEDAAPIGSVYLRDDAEANGLQLYYKFATGGNSAADWHVSASQTYVDAIATGLSWREPAKVRDNTSYADITAAETAANVGDTVDGVTIVVDDRLLFTNLDDQETIAAQDETNFNGAGNNGTFVGGTGFAPSPGIDDGDTITLSDGTVVTIDNVAAGGDVDQFTILSASTTPFAPGATLTQTGTTGSGTSFTLTPGTANEAQVVPDVNNVYIVSGGTGAWTFTEDTNVASDGDALLINEGTSADEQYVYDGTNWILFGSAGDAAELGFIRDFIGKTGPGAETPTYSSADVITQSTNLESAIGELDNAFGDGEITNDGGNYSLSDDMLWATAGTLTLTAALNEINEAIGDRTYTEDNFVTDGETIASSIDALDQALSELANITTLNVIAERSVDSIPLSECEWAKWLVTFEDVTNTNRRRSGEIDGITDGTTVDHNEFAKLRFGGNIAGLTTDVVVVAENTIAAQDEANFDGAGSNGTFVGGTLYANTEVITMSDGSTITVDLQVAGVITQFTVTTASTIPFGTGATISAVSSTLAGNNDFTITTGTNNEATGTAALQLLVASSTGVDVTVRRIACGLFN